MDKRCELLALPAEIRVRIYEELADSVPVHTAIASVCQKTYCEYLDTIQKNFALVDCKAFVAHLPKAWIRQCLHTATGHAPKLCRFQLTEGQNEEYAMQERGISRVIVPYDALNCYLRIMETTGKTCPFLRTGTVWEVATFDDNSAQAASFKRLYENLVEQLTPPEKLRRILQAHTMAIDEAVYETIRSRRIYGFSTIFDRFTWTLSFCYGHVELKDQLDRRHLIMQALAASCLNYLSSTSRSFEDLQASQMVEATLRSNPDMATWASPGIMLRIRHLMETMQLSSPNTNMTHLKLVRKSLSSLKAHYGHQMYEQLENDIQFLQGIDESGPCPFPAAAKSLSHATRTHSGQLEFATVDGTILALQADDLDPAEKRMCK